MGGRFFYVDFCFLCCSIRQIMCLDVFIPRVHKSSLLLVAALVWTFAGGMLLYKGADLRTLFSVSGMIKLTLSLLAGLIFYNLIFIRISKKHVTRILSMEEEKPFVLAFFNMKSYLMMFSMITLGILLRKSGVLSPEYLSAMYLTMGFPLLLSSFRFYITFLNS